MFTMRSRAISLGMPVWEMSEGVVHGIGDLVEKMFRGHCSETGRERELQDHQA